MSFEFAPAGEDFPDGLRQIKIEVNGVELPDLVREAELPSARSDEEEEMAGNYIGLVAGYMRIDLAGQFLGGQGTPMFEGDGEQTALLGCGCGEVGCSPLMARITVTDRDRHLGRLRAADASRLGLRGLRPVQLRPRPVRAGADGDRRLAGDR